MEQPIHLSPHRQWPPSTAGNERARLAALALVLWGSALAAVVALALQLPAAAEDAPAPGAEALVAFVAGA